MDQFLETEIGREFFFLLILSKFIFKWQFTFNGENIQKSKVLANFLQYHPLFGRGLGAIIVSCRFPYRKLGDPR